GIQQTKLWRGGGMPVTVFEMARNTISLLIVQATRKLHRHLSWSRTITPGTRVTPFSRELHPTTRALWPNLSTKTAELLHAVTEVSRKADKSLPILCLFPFVFLKRPT